MTTVRFIREKRGTGGFAYLLGFVEPVDLIKEYDRLSIHPCVRLAADMKRTYRPSSKLTEVLGIFKSLTQLTDSRVGGTELFKNRIARFCQKPCQGSFPATG